jgi:lysophospholipase L1-like esterase
LQENNVSCVLLDNPARNGFSTQDLITHELPLVQTLHPDFVTLLIGVNDWVRQVPKAEFEKNLQYILNMLQANLPEQHRILLITIPDFGVTPEGKHYGGGRNIAAGISEFNEVIKREADQRHLPLVDVFELSKKMGTDASLVSSDGLHPSAKEYAEWEKWILKEILVLLK